MNFNSQPNDPTELYILWTSGDREVALSMVLMYTFNAKTRGWWDQVTLIVWGSSAKLLASDEELQGRIKQMIESGVKVMACESCADMFGVTQKLKDIGILVQGMGQPLSEWLQAGKKVLSI